MRVRVREIENASEVETRKREIGRKRGDKEEREGEGWRYIEI